MQRDRLTWLVYGHLGLWGYFLFGFGPVIPLLRDDLEISNTVAGLHASMIAAGSITASLLYPRLADSLGRQRVALLGTAGLATGALLLATGTTLAQTLTGTLVAGGFGSLLVTGSAVVLTVRHGSAAPGAITEANAAAAAAGLLAPAFVAAAVALGLGWRPAPAAVAVLAVLLVVILGREPVPDSDPAGVPTAAPDRRLPRAYWPAWVVVATVIGVEAAMIVWSSELLRERLDMSDGAAAAAVSALLAGMLAGRLAGGRLARAHPGDRLLLGAFGLAGVGVGIFVTAGSPAVAVAALTVTGAGMSLHYPLAVTRALKAAGPGMADRAAGRAAVGVGLVGGATPPVMGALVDAADVRVAFGVVPVLLLVATAAVLAGRRLGGVAQPR